jgi:hypothetical protein
MPFLPPTYRLAAAALACAAAMLTATTAHASQQLGHTAAPSDPITCSFGPSITIAGDSPDYRAPADGVITALRTGNAGNFNTSLSLRVFRDEGTSIVGIARREVKLTASGNALADTRIPVEEGDRIGLTTTTGTGVVCVSTGTLSDAIRSFPGDPADGLAFPAAQIKGMRVNVSATFELDADRDGFGDDSQDGCATSAGTQGECPPPPPSSADTTPADPSSGPAPATDPAPANAPAPIEPATAPTVQPSSTTIAAAAACRIAPRKLRGLALKRAKRRIRKANCAVGRVRKARDAHGKLTVRRAKRAGTKVRLTVA